jgi:hypothetical protein
MEGDVRRLQRGEAGFDFVADDHALGFEGLDGSVDVASRDYRYEN